MTSVAKSAAAGASRCAATEPSCQSEWQPTSSAPAKPGDYIEVRSVTVYRWLPYKPDGARQMKKKGRWQAHDGYGFTNEELPENAEWRPLPARSEGQ